MALLCVTIFSCKKDNCRPIVITAGLVYSDSVLIDTVVNVVQCEKGSHFTNRLDSTYCNISYVYKGAGSPTGAFGYTFEDPGKDYLIVFVQSGTVFELGNISYGHEKYHLRNENIMYCSYGYSLNGVAHYMGVGGDDSHGQKTSHRLDFRF